MSNSLQKIWIHAIWSTCETAPLIRPGAEQRLYDYMKQQFAEHGCPVWIINGMADHVHCLFLLSAQISLCMLIKQIKGMSAHFVNQQQLTDSIFGWQNGYAAYSIGATEAAKEFEYIGRQKILHQQIGFREEYDTFMEAYHGNQEEHGCG